MSERRPQTEAELIEHVRSIDAPAPVALHERVAALVAEHEARDQPSAHERATTRRRGAGAPPRLAALGLGLAMAAVAVAVVALVIARSGASGTLTVARTSALALSPATSPAPAHSATVPTELAADVEGVAFPYWEDRFGWRADGARRDRVDGRTVTTVFYIDASGRRVGYAIVSGTPAPAPVGGVLRWRRGTAYHLSVEHGGHVVSWLRDGRLCVLAGRGVPGATLLALASSDARAV